MSFRCPNCWSKSTRLANSNPLSRESNQLRMATIPSALLAVCRELMDRPANKSSTFPTPCRAIPATAKASSSVVRGGASDEGPADHAGDVMRRDEKLARNLAAGVQLLERDHLLVRRELEDGIRRGVENPLARLLVLGTEAVDDVRTASGDIADDAAA